MAPPMGAGRRGMWAGPGGRPVTIAQRPGTGRSRHPRRRVVSGMRLLWLRPWRRGPLLLLKRPGVALALVAPADPLLDALEIAHLADRYPSLTSGGEQQRTAMAGALRLRPTLLLADEPTGHQDRGRVDLTLAVLRQHAYSGHAVLISSHD